MSKFDLNNTPIFSDSVESKIGVYFIIALGRNSQPIKIKRLLEDDSSGILYIGKTERGFKDRMSQFNHTLRSKKNYNSHSAAFLIKSTHKLKNYVEKHRLIVEIFPSKDPDRKEYIELKKYQNKFGELPPLNSSMPVKYLRKRKS